MLLCFKSHVHGKERAPLRQGEAFFINTFIQLSLFHIIVYRCTGLSSYFEAYTAICPCHCSVKLILILLYHIVFQYLHLLFKHFALTILRILYNYFWRVEGVPQVNARAHVSLTRRIHLTGVNPFIKSRMSHYPII